MAFQESMAEFASPFVQNTYWLLVLFGGNIQATLCATRKLGFERYGRNMMIDPLTMDDGSSDFAKRRSPGAIAHMSVPGDWHMLASVMLKMRSGFEPSPQSTQVAVMLPFGS